MVQPEDFLTFVGAGEDRYIGDVAEKLGVMPSECVVMEDAVNGVQAAKEAGMRCVVVATSFPPNLLREADVSLSDLAPHLAKS